MINRDKVINEINSIIGEELLEKAVVKDEMANGVQILGKEDVEKVALGVSLNEEFLQKSVEWGADMCIFHHGFDTRAWRSRYPLHSQKRFRLIFENDLTIIGLHYVLDAHEEIGNNALIIKELGAKIDQAFADEWGYVGEFAKPRSLHDLAHECQKLFDHDVFVVQANDNNVRRIGVVSGGFLPKASDLAEMEAKKVDLLITGETSEWLPHQMKESEINYFVCGHYATEVLGIKALGDKIKNKFSLRIKVKYIDVTNEI